MTRQARSALNAATLSCQSTRRGIITPAASARLLAAALSAFLVLVPARASADPIIIVASNATGDGTEWNFGVNDLLDTPQATVLLTTTAEPFWAAPFTGSSWVSFADERSPSSTAQTSTPDQNPDDLLFNGDWVTFYHSFFLPEASSYTALLNIRADDTVTVLLNGHMIFLAQGPWNESDNDYFICSNVGIGCRNPVAYGDTAGYLDIGAFAVAGENLFEFKVFQRNGDAFGLNYTAEFRPASVPEPSSLLLLGTGLLGTLAAARRGGRRKKKGPQRY